MIIKDIITTQSKLKSFLKLIKKSLGELQIIENLDPDDKIISWITYCYILNEKIIGYAIVTEYSDGYYFYDDFIWQKYWLSLLEVKRSERGLGIGKELLNYIISDIQDILFVYSISNSHPFYFINNFYYLDFNVGGKTIMFHNPSSEFISYNTYKSIVEERCYLEEDLISECYNYNLQYSQRRYCKPCRSLIPDIVSECDHDNSSISYKTCSSETCSSDSTNSETCSSETCSSDSTNSDSQELIDLP
jgi:GNAT superfamily N-acetyltransferase